MRELRSRIPILTIISDVALEITAVHLLEAERELSQSP